MIAQATPLPEILERDWDRQLFAAGRKPGFATQLLWRSHWTFNSKGSAHGAAHAANELHSMGYPDN